MKLLYPTRFPHITQPYGAKSSSYKDYHHGVDFRTWNDTEKQILATQDGEVIHVDTKSTCNNIYDANCKGSTYGMHIIVRHNIDNKVQYSLYGHLSEIKVGIGDRVVAGQWIGRGGNTGYSSAEHLHFEFRVGENQRSSAVDPTPYFTSEINNIPEWGREGWEWCQKHGIISESTEFSDSDVTMGRISVVMHNLASKIMEWSDENPDVDKALPKE